MKAIVVLLCLAAAATARTPREAPKPETNYFEKLLEEGVSVFGQVRDHVQHMIAEAPDAKKVQQTVEENGKKLWESLEKVKDTLQKEIESASNTTVKAALEKMVGDVQHTAEDIKKQVEVASPELAKGASEMQANIQKSTDKLLNDVKQMMEDVKPQVDEAGKQIKDALNKVVDETMKNMKKLETNLHAETGHSH